MTSFNAPAERDINWGPERTSIVAIIALVFALPCFIPGFGIIASLLAVFALVGIAGSKGRVGGTGLAIAALVLGLFSTALWTAIGYGMWQGASYFKEHVFRASNTIMIEVRDGEFDKARVRFVQSSADQLTPEKFEAFRAAYRERLGEFKGIPDTVQGIVDGYSALSSQKNALGDPPPNNIPIPAIFEKGTFLMMIEIAPNQKVPQSSTISLPLRNLAIFPPGADPITLINPELLRRRPAANGNAETKTGTEAPTTPETSEAPKPDAPAKPVAPTPAPAPAPK
ncbi:MAG: hypothetical protein J0L78_14755 [Planctomycetes bacterium]|nr:hypothetical protein [Planctomycetota bacterium]